MSYFDNDHLNKQSNKCLFYIWLLFKELKDLE